MKLKTWISIFILGVSCTLFCGNGQTSFTPDEIDFPILSISLSTEITGTDPSGEVYDLYTCTSDDCHVRLFSDTTDNDISDNDQLPNLAMSSEIKEAPYRYLTISSCTANQTTFNATVKGIVTVTKDDVPKEYYTETSYGLKEREAQNPELVNVTFSDCNMYYELQEDMDINDSITSPLTLFLDVTDIAWVSMGVQTTASGCGQYKDIDGDIVSICLGYPHLIPVQSTASPTVETYNIYNDGSAASTAGGRIVLYIDPTTNEPIGGFSRLLFSYTSELPSYPLFFTSVKRITQTATGAYSFSTYGLYSDTTYMNFTNFSRADHDSSTGTERAFTDNDGNSYLYAADKLD